MSKLALYRYYRPRVFADVIGQPHIVSTLRNQVKSGNISHAYLFCGTRGTGKTSTAQILSRAVNCLDPQDGEPCGQCAICTLTSNPDVWEIDAASNNGVDQIRDLRDKVRFAPLESRYKVYIIDEVHMLSDGAFNALLKTLEEPPPHAVFILATTEPQKLPATILSRCQRFDFHRIDIQSLIEQLKAVLDDQGIRYDVRALEKIALLADGGSRDALSMLDQCIAFSGDSLTYERVLDILGNVDDSVLANLATALFSGQAANALEILETALQNGRDVAVLARDLMAYLRTLLLALTSATSIGATLQLSEEDWQTRRALAQSIGIAPLLEASDLLAKLDAQLRRATQPRLLLETTLLRICFRDELSRDVPAHRPSHGAANLAAATPPTAPASTAMSPTSEAPQPVPATEETAPPPPKASALPPQAEKAPPAQNSNPVIPAAEASASQAVLDALIAKQGAGIQHIFKMYTWEHQLNGNTLEIVAPAGCLPALLQTLKNSVDGFSTALQDDYPGIRVQFVAALSSAPAATPTDTPKVVAPEPAVEAAQGEAIEKHDLYNAAVQLFGSDVVVREE